jgi:hypothetical protein
MAINFENYEPAEDVAGITNLHHLMLIVRAVRYRLWVQEREKPHYLLQAAIEHLAGAEGLMRDLNRKQTGEADKTDREDRDENV